MLSVFRTALLKFYFEFFCWLILCVNCLPVWTYGDAAYIRLVGAWEHLCDHDLDITVTGVHTSVGVTPRVPKSNTDTQPLALQRPNTGPADMVISPPPLMCSLKVWGTWVNYPSGFWKLYRSVLIICELGTSGFDSTWVLDTHWGPACTHRKWAELCSGQIQRCSSCPPVDPISGWGLTVLPSEKKKLLSLCLSSETGRSPLLQNIPCSW